MLKAWRLVDSCLLYRGWLWDFDIKRFDLDAKLLTRRVHDITGLDTTYRETLSSSEPFQVIALSA